MDQRLGTTAGLEAVRGTLEDPAYVYAMQAFDSFFNSMNRRFGEPWPRRQYANHTNWGAFVRIGQMCAAENWPPEDFVEGALDQLHKRHRYITAKDLLVPAVVQRARTEWLMRNTLHDPGDEWRCLVQSLLTYMRLNDVDEIAVLTCPLTPFPAWFRLVYPEQLDDRILKYYGESGRNELARDRRLRAFIRTVAPKAVDALAAVWGRWMDTEVQS